MTNLKLVPDAPTPLEKMLLDASRAELPSEDHKARLRAALGIGLPLSGPLSSPAPALGAGSGQAAAAGTAPTAAVATASAGAAKSVTLGKVALGAAVAALVGALFFTRHSTAPMSIAVTKAPVVQVAAPAPAPVSEPVTAVSPLPPLEEAAAAPHVARADASSATVDLSEQIRLIEAARAGVAAHDPKTALAALDTYSAKFPRGSFGQEAMVLRIRAVDQAGDSARATALAKAFVARFPNSPHVARLKPIAERGTSR